MSSVLLVDDSPVDRSLLRGILAREGYEVHEVPCGDEARSKAIEARPHVIVFGGSRPGSDGAGVLRALRTEPALAEIPVLLLTVPEEEHDLLVWLDAGADDFLARDSATEILLARVRRLVRYRQMAAVSVLNEQLAQIGRLLAGIIHEIRGPLSVIRGNAELMRMSLGEDHPAERWVEPIIRNSQVLQVRLEHLMAAVRTTPSVFRAVEVASLLQESVDLFLKGCEPGDQVAVVVEAARALPPVRGDAGRLMQVILNLLCNAREAILSVREQGRVVVAAADSVDGDRRRVRRR